MSKKHVGSNFDDFLAEEAMLEEATATAVKRVIAWQIEQEMKAQKLTKTALASKMKTSRAALHRFTDLLGKNFLIVVTAFRALFLVGAQSGFYQHHRFLNFFQTIDGHTTGAYPVAVPPGTAGFLKTEARF